jgi:hypothetical protein
MADDRPPLPSSIHAVERDRVIRTLGDHFAYDHLTLDEYEKRVERALHVQQAVELEALTHDLPALVTDAMPNASADAASPVTPLLEAQASSRPKTFLAAMSGVVRRGRWIVPARIRAFAFMGGVELDLREAQFTSPVTDIYAVAIMGGIEVRVPPHVRLEVDGVAIMGGFEDQIRLPEAGGASAPVVRVRGFALMGGVEARSGDRERDD